MSLVTLLEIDGNYPVPVTFEEQEELLSVVSEQIVIDFQAKDPQTYKSITSGTIDMLHTVCSTCCKI